MINGIITALLIVIFLGIWIWAWSRKNEEQFKTMANLPLEDDADRSQEKDRE